MDCARFHDQLEPWRSGQLDDAATAWMEHHRSECPECATVARLAGPGVGSATEAVAVRTLAKGVLAHTTGEVCARAQRELPEWVDGGLSASDAELVGEHVEHCARCRALAQTLEQLRPVLQAMASREPDPGFAEAVLRRTSRSRRARARRAILGGLGRARLPLSGLAQTPRRPMELAYLFTLLLVLLTATPYSPWPGLPSRALAVVHEVSLPSQDHPLAGSLEKLGAVRRGRIAHWTDEVAGIWQEHVGARTGRAADSMGCLRVHGAQLAGALAHADLDRVTPALTALGYDLQRLWDGLRLRRPSNTAEC